ncbi:hypothetical protein DNTS_024619, partial [Danionella cerebrum]
WRNVKRFVFAAAASAKKRANNTPAAWLRKRVVPGMPKKFQGENSKAATAKARKAEAKAVADARRQKELEDALWEDNDKHVMKKEQRRDDKEKKRLEALERKRENQRLFEEEDSKLKGKQAKEAACKVTRAQIEENLQSKQGVKEIKEKGKCRAYYPKAFTWGECTKEDLDRHPERRMKAAYAAFEELNMPRLKMENPNMRLSQLKQQLKKEWTKSPENPLNQRVASFNSK